MGKWGLEVNADGQGASLGGAEKNVAMIAQLDKYVRRC